jgi:hypothetical protein
MTNRRKVVSDDQIFGGLEHEPLMQLDLLFMPYDRNEFSKNHRYG